jgi:predicted PurR-regulated permease PerM
MVDEWEASGRRRDLGILYIFGSFVLLMSALIIWFLPSLLQELNEASIAFGSYLDDAPERLGPWVHRIEAWFGIEFTSFAPGSGQPTEVQPGQLLLQLFPFAISGTVGLGVFFVNILLFPVFCFYMLRDWDSILNWFEQLVPPRNRPRARRLARAIDVKIGAFVWGQLIIAGALGTLYALGLMALGLDVAVAVGGIAGLLSMVPYLGLFVGVAMAAGAAALQFGLDWHLAGVIGVFGGAQMLETLFITPKIMGDKVGLHPLVIMIVLVAGGTIFGLWGMILAIPMAASAQVLMVDWLRLYRASRYYRVAG